MENQRIQEEVSEADMKKIKAEEIEFIKTELPDLRLIAEYEELVTKIDMARFTRVKIQNENINMMMQQKKFQMEHDAANKVNDKEVVEPVKS